jgi:hypothetical protein
VLPVGVGLRGKRVMMTSGRNRRMASTTSASTASCPQMESDSSGLFE